MSQHLSERPEMSAFSNPGFVDDTAFREALSTLPAGVSVVTAVEPDGRPQGATVSAFASLSLNPPLVLVSLDCTARTLRAISSRPAFAVHVLSAEHEELALRFAANGEDKFALTPFSLNQYGIPLLEEFAARIECSVYAQHVAGDHAIVIGMVEAVTIANLEPTTPMVWFKRQFRRLEN